MANFACNSSWASGKRQGTSVWYVNAIYPGWPNVEPMPVASPGGGEQICKQIDFIVTFQTRFIDLRRILILILLYQISPALKEDENWRDKIGNKKTNYGKDWTWEKNMGNGEMREKQQNIWELVSGGHIFVSNCESICLKLQNIFVVSVGRSERHNSVR